MKYQDEKFYWSYQHSVHWPDDYLGPDSMTHWIIEASDGFTDVELLKISESVRAYAYLILSSQTSARSSIIGNTVSALTAQSAFLNNFENVVNRRVNIQEDITRYQDTLSYASSKVDYSIGESIYMLCISQFQAPTSPWATPRDFPQLSARVSGFVPSEFPGGPPGVEPIT